MLRLFYFSSFQSVSSSWKISFTLLPNTCDIFSTSVVEGLYFPNSMALMVWRLT